LREILAIEFKPALSAADQYIESNSSVGEIIQNDPLTPLIEANAQMLVRCPWMDNESVTLSAAVIAYSERVALITAENIHIVASKMSELLANPVIETEQLQEETARLENEQSVKAEEEFKIEEKGTVQIKEVDKLKEEKPTKAKDTAPKKTFAEKNEEDQVKSIAVVEKGHIKDGIKGDKQLKQPVLETEKFKEAKSGIVTVTKGEAVSTTIASDAEKAAQDAVKKDEGNHSLLNGSINTECVEPPKMSEVSPAISSTSESPTHKSHIEKNNKKTTPTATSAKVQLNEAKPLVGSEVEAKQQLETFEIPEMNVTTNAMVEVSPVLSRPQLVADQESDSTTLPVSVEATVEAASIALAPVGPESTNIPERTIEPDSEENEAVGGEVVVAAASAEPNFTEIPNADPRSLSITEPEPTESSSSYLEIRTTLDDTVELATEMIEAGEEELALKDNSELNDELIERNDELTLKGIIKVADEIGLIEDKVPSKTIDHQIGAISLSSFVEKDMVGNLGVTELDPNELEQVFAAQSTEEGRELSIQQKGKQASYSEQEGAADAKPEKLPETRLQIVEVDEILIQLVEQIVAAEPEDVEAMNEILDKLIEVPSKLEARDYNLTAEAEIQEEIEELYTDLLDNMRIEYTPELIETLTRLTIKWRLAEKIKEPKQRDIEDEVPSDPGTHEAIRRLLLGLSNTQKMAHAYALGKSALHLCDFNLAA
jgi:hypothetical protein